MICDAALTTAYSTTVVAPTSESQCGTDSRISQAGAVKQALPYLLTMPPSLPASSTRSVHAFTRPAQIRRVPPGLSRIVHGGAQGIRFGEGYFPRTRIEPPYLAFSDLSPPPPPPPPLTSPSPSIRGWALGPDPLTSHPRTTTREFCHDDPTPVVPDSSSSSVRVQYSYSPLP